MSMETQQRKDAMQENRRERPMVSDRLFAEKKDLVRNFAFARNPVRVFDDMLNRSVPFSAEIQRVMAEVAADFAVDRTNIYDLGCSLRTTLESWR